MKSNIVGILEILTVVGFIISGCGVVAYVINPQLVNISFLLFLIAASVGAAVVSKIPKD